MVSGGSGSIGGTGAHGATRTGTPEIAAACGAGLGEGPVWDHRIGAVLWVDIAAATIWRLDVAAGEAHATQLPERAGFVALTPDPDVVVAGLETRLVAFDLIDRTLRDLAPVEPALPGNRCNDAVVGLDGTLWFSTMDAGETAETGAFHAFDGRAVSTIEDGFVVTNGPALSPDGRTLYTIDTTGKRITMRAVLAEDGDARLGPASLFLDLGEEAGVPDGVTIGEEGDLWIAMHGAGRLLRVDAEGVRKDVLVLPTPDITKATFGGPDLSTLYVATAARARPHDPLAGHLFRIETDARGLPAQLFRAVP
ncbi:SMP-30/gluconolactonase/LRE family protein [Salinarimonas ramus]|uniref:Gluconolaconase n=1 Tax=Salinarimonas ramus TaxID=690164 RepID=A0A917V590_9HYPH|nr:SMP-30/gluconolactonase/LRE family protein [Salinarimonas ramus]GGK41704.1 gluconolaconase [Salinarimonas ramus]